MIARTAKALVMRSTSFHTVKKETSTLKDSNPVRTRGDSPPDRPPADSLPSHAG